MQGLDPVDYDAIDSDLRLDEHWAAVINRDAEDVYFQEEPEDDNEGRKDEYDY